MKTLLNKTYRLLRDSRQRVQYLLAYLLVAIAFFITAMEIRQQGNEGRTAIVASGRAIAVYGCNRDFKSTMALRNIVIAFGKREAESFRKGDISAATLKRTKVYIRSQLINTPLPDCRKATGVITDDPGRTTRMPQPLFPR